jgi:two-component system, LytTR family, sensor kinase
VVENAIQHAVAPRATRSHIDVAAKRLDGLLRLEVRDDGPGIPANGEAEDRQRVGLNNVRARLDQIYGRDFRFELATRLEGGLTVVMEIPFQHEAS